MTALEVILKSRLDSVAKLHKQIADLDAAIRDCSLTVKPVYEAERRIKQQRLERLDAEVKALQAEVERVSGPLLPGMPPPKVAPKK